MAKSLEEILHYSNLCGTIQDPRGGLPSDIIPAGFFRTTRRIQGQTGTYFKVDGTRKTARLAHYGDPSRRRELKGISEVPFKCMHAKEHIMHNPDTLTQLMNTNGAVQRLGEQEVARQTVAFRDLFNNLRLSAVYSILRYGAVYFDGDGNLLPSSSGAVTTVDFQHASTHEDQLNWDGNGAIISASWATAGTDIAAQIKDLKGAAVRSSGYRITTAFYGTNILGYLIANTDLKQYIAANPAFAAGFANNEIPNGMLGLNWVPVDEAFFEDQNGAFQDWWGGDTVVFTPDPSPDWWEVIDGSYPVPTDLGRVGPDGNALLSAVQQVQGMGSYALLEADPTTIKHIAFDTWLPIPKVPNAYFVADVTP